MMEGMAMAGRAGLERLLCDRGLLLAVGEVLAQSMNGPSARRLAWVLDEIALDPESTLMEPADREWLLGGLREASHRADRIEHWRGELKRLAGQGVSVLACFDKAYPTNLALTHDHPPLLFVQGELTKADRNSVSMVGTRDATPDGLTLAGRLAGELANRGVTIVSGLARGIDTAAHSAALDAGGRTIAVYGTAIDHVYPRENRELARAIRQQGACVSQFMPGISTGRWAFPARNITSSGLSLGTIVVEASKSSGARLQAEAAIAHGKRVFLVESLVANQPWAAALAEKNGLVTIATDVDTIMAIATIELGMTK